MASFLLLVLPAIWLAARGYMWTIEHGLKIDTHARPDGIMDRLVILAMLLPMIPVMLVAILVAGIPWMLLMARLLPWADIQFFSRQKGPRFPPLSDWLDRLWLRMIEHRGRRTPPDRPSS